MKTILSACALLPAALLLAGCSIGTNNKQEFSRQMNPGLILNEDFESFMATYPPEEMTEEGLKRQIDRYAAGGPKDLLFCGNGMRAMFDSRTFEPYWQGIEIRPDGKWFFHGHEVTDKQIRVLSNVKNGKRLHEQVKDPYDVRIRYGRSKGMKVFASMRMNDVHCANDPDNLMLSDWWRAHQDCRIAPWNGEWWGQGLDYSRKEVFDHHLALAEEYLTRFDLDGLELDWMRTPYYFRPGCEAENASILTEFHRKVRAIADDMERKNGHKILIYARVPSRPDDARRMGFDVPTWVKEKLVDLIIPTSYWGVTDGDIPVELWHALLGRKFPVAPGLEIYCRSTPDGTPMTNTPEIVFGYAAANYYRGADKIYLFNHMDGLFKRRSSYRNLRRILETAGDRKKTEDARRRHVVSYLDILGQACGRGYDNRLPLKVTPWSVHLRINIGGGIRKGRKVRLAIASEGTIREVRLNTVLCQESKEVFQDPLPKDIRNIRLLEIPEGAAHDGDNVVSFSGDGRILWCEIDVEAAR